MLPLKRATYIGLALTAPNSASVFLTSDESAITAAFKSSNSPSRPYRRSTARSSFAAAELVGSVVATDFGLSSLFVVVPLLTVLAFAAATSRKRPSSIS